ncbi:MAG: hypothetical protein N3I35_19470 [Clostridia bacterium]|nr:hypothetical protein [Clostridia bacterium]
MFSPEHLNPFVKEIMSRLTGQNSGNGLNSTKSNSGNQSDKPCINITPSQALVIAGIIGGVLEVTSVLVDKDQLVQIILSGSLKRKTELEKILDQIGSMPFDDVMKALLERLA